MEDKRGTPFCLRCKIGTQMETLTATATATFIVSSGWLPTKQDKRNAHNTHSKCQSVFNEQRALAAPPSLATLVAPLACCCDFLRKSENQLARNQIERRVGVATAAATSQHRQCCGKQGRRERGRERQKGVATTTGRRSNSSSSS